MQKNTENMSMILKIAAVSSIIGVILNIVLAYVLFPFATPEQIKPPNGAQNLPFMSQFMHMIVHHKQVLFTSSLIVAIVVGLSVVLATMSLAPYNCTNKYFFLKRPKF